MTPSWRRPSIACLPAARLRPRRRWNNWFRVSLRSRCWLINGAPGRLGILTLDHHSPPKRSRRHTSTDDDTQARSILNRSATFWRTTCLQSM